MISFHYRLELPNFHLGVNVPGLRQWNFFFFFFWSILKFCYPMQNSIAWTYKAAYPKCETRKNANHLASLLLFSGAWWSQYLARKQVQHYTPLKHFLQVFRQMCTWTSALCSRNSQFWLQKRLASITSCVLVKLRPRLSWYSHTTIVTLGTLLPQYQISDVYWVVLSSLKISQGHCIYRVSV